VEIAAFFVLLKNNDGMLEDPMVLVGIACDKANKWHLKNLINDDLHAHLHEVRGTICHQLLI